MSKFGDVFYISGSQNPRNNKPRTGYNLRCMGKGLKLFYSPSGLTQISRKRDFIAWENVISVNVDHDIRNDTSLDKLFGMKNVVSTIRIKYKRSDGKSSELVLQSQNAEKYKAKINKKLEKIR